MGIDDDGGGGCGGGVGGFVLWSVVVVDFVDVVVVGGVTHWWYVVWVVGIVSGAASPLVVEYFLASCVLFEFGILYRSFVFFSHRKQTINWSYVLSRDDETCWNEK